MICTICHHRGLRGDWRRCDAHSSEMQRRPMPDGRFYGPMCATVLRADGTCGDFVLNRRVSDGVARVVVERIQEEER